MRCSGTPVRLTRMMCSPIRRSLPLSTESWIIQTMSNREIKGGGRSICLWRYVDGSPQSTSLKRPSLGFAAARTAHLVGMVALIPPLLMLIRCCSIASCIAPRSSGVILSNSSTAHRPRSARTRAPASNEKRPSLNASLTAAAVNPAALVPPPVVNRPRGEIRPMKESICDLATPGSPSNRM